MSTLDNLRKDAKRWLKALRSHDAEARTRLERAWPHAPAQPGLRDIQHALARERGAQNWKELTAAAAASEPAARDRRDVLAAFLEYACWDNDVHGRGDYDRNARAALRILEQHPEIARHSIFTAVVCGEIGEVRRILAAQPQAARESGGARAWPPLVYLCYARAPLPAAGENALEIARLLLDHGADPNAYYMAGDSPYTALVGVAGEGEQDALPHPQAAALYQLLLDRGAGPYDIQVLYNTHFRGNVLWWLELTYRQCVKLGRESEWRDPHWPMFDMGPYGSGARYLLGIAVTKHDLKLAEWVLSHGAGPNEPPARDPRYTKRTLYQDALARGLSEMAALLARYGAAQDPPLLDPDEQFTAACLRGDWDEARSLAAQHPELLRSPHAIFAAASADRADVVAFLLDLGVSIEIQDRQKQRPLHVAAAEDAVHVAELLIERGAEIDPHESHWNAVPIGFARYGHKQAMLDLLGRYTRDVWALTVTGKVQRLRQVLAQQPELARVVNRAGFTPLCWLPEDEALAEEAVGLLLAHGADPSIAAADGTTPADYARKRGLHAAARKLAAAKVKLPDSSQPAFAVQSGEARPRRALAPGDWDQLLAAMADRKVSGLAAGGQMTDAVLERMAALPHVTHLDLSGSAQVTDEGLRHLRRMPQLESLNLSGCRITDRGLEVLRALPALRRLELYHHGAVTDTGAAHLAECRVLEHVDLMNTPTGDGAIAALGGMRRLSHFKAGNQVTDAGLALLANLPVFQAWQGGAVEMSLMSPDARPSFLWLSQRGPYTNAGLAHVARLEGLFALSLFGNPGGPYENFQSPVTPAGLQHLAALPHLGWLGCTAGLCDDEAMRHIGRLPHLRMLMGQGAVAGDDGFAALSRSSTLEYFWGRECPNLTGRGFSAMAKMPSLRGLAVSCKNVDDASLALLPRFPALRQLMPMDVADEGFRHVGRCQNLEELWCMYCRDTTDAATEHIAGLLQLKTYYAGKTRITDRSLEILSRMESLEVLRFWQCDGITDAGIALLARLPKLREVHLESMPQVALEGNGPFPSQVLLVHR